MNRQSFAFAAAGVLGLSAVMLGACGRAPTGPSYASQGVQEPEASVAAPARAAVVAAPAPDGEASVDAREEALAARERELRAQQDELRREREQLAAERARAGDTVTATSNTAFDADQAVVPAPGAPTSSIRKVPTPPVVVPPGTPLQIELAANVNTRVARVGDRIEGRLAEDLVINDRRAAVAGAVVSGKVTELAAGADRVDAPTLEVTFDSLQAANGAMVPIVARYVERRELRAGTVISVPTETSFSIY